MKKNKILPALLILIIGVGLGWLIKPNNVVETHEPNDMQDTSATNTHIWTCSMHPQIRQNEPGACPICGMDLIPADDNTNENPLVLEMTEDAVKLANIQTSVVGQVDGVSNNWSLAGRVKADETKVASLVSHIPGRIEKLYVSFTGEYVKKGQKIATIYAADLISAQRELLVAQELKDSSPGLLESAKNKLRFWKIREQTIQAIIERNEVKEYFDIYADYDGVVTNRNVSVGDHTMAGTPLFQVQNLYNLWVLFDVYEKDLSKVKVGQMISFTTPAVPNKIFRSRITFIDPSINPMTRVATVRATISNVRGQLKPEMFVNGTLKAIKSSNKGLNIPKSAVLWTGKRSVVYVKTPNMQIPSFEFREIEIVDSETGFYRVNEGLEEGEEVVTNGAFVIDASAQLNNQSSMMNRLAKVKDVEETNDEVVPDYKKETPDDFKKQLEEVLGTYLGLKDALVQTDAKIAAQKGAIFLDALTKVDMLLLKGEAHLYWMKQLDRLEGHGQKIKEIKDVEKQRSQFDFLSQAMIHSTKAFGVSSQTYYVQHCPMAFDNKGADWISSENYIQNPYFGDKMIKCGVVQDTIK